MTSGEYITAEMKAAIGKESEPRESSMEATASEHRRFIHAIMDDDPIYYDEEYAKKTRYGAIVCPPLFPTSVSRRQLGTPDPVTEGFKANPDFDALAASGQVARPGDLPQLDLSHIPRMLNGGNSIEFFQYMKLGEKTVSKTRIVDIYEREGRSGHMVFMVNETEVRNDKGELLMRSRGVSIRR